MPPRTNAAVPTPGGEHDLRALIASVDGKMDVLLERSAEHDKRILDVERIVVPRDEITGLATRVAGLEVGNAGAPSKGDFVEMLARLGKIEQHLARTGSISQTVEVLVSRTGLLGTRVEKLSDTPGRIDRLVGRVSTLETAATFQRGFLRALWWMGPILAAAFGVGGGAAAQRFLGH